MSTFTNAEHIGVGPMWQGSPHPGRSEHPRPYPSGEPMGLHLRVERLLRIVQGRMLYLVNNHGPKWGRRKCWACGNKYTPTLEKCCSYCLTPLRDLRFLLSVRSEEDTFGGFQQLVQQRLRLFGLVSPVLLFYRDDLQFAVYHYNGERLLVDATAPLPSDQLLGMAYRLGETLGQLHDQGVVLRRFGAHNVLLMPDGTARFFDLDAKGVGGPVTPVRDIKRLGRMLERLCSPDHAELRSFLLRAATGAFTDARTFTRAVERMLMAGGALPTPSAATAYTDLGLTRARNEDTWSWLRMSQQSAIYVVADGMGGHDAGDVASKIAATEVVDAMSRAPGKASLKLLEGFLRKALEAANTAVKDYAFTHKAKMGTTLVAALVVGRQAVIANAGDSRAYLFRLGKLLLLSKDHSLVQELVDAGTITPEAARNHPHGHVLTVTVGAEESLEMNLARVDLQPGDRLLLCSDGLWGQIADDRIAYHLGANADRHEATQALVRAAYEAGGTDNITVVLVDI